MVVHGNWKPFEYEQRDSLKSINFKKIRRSLLKEVVRNKQKSKEKKSFLK